MTGWVKSGTGRSGDDDMNQEGKGGEESIDQLRVWPMHIISETSREELQF